jgi:lysophospholipase L1-like esterase
MAFVFSFGAADGKLAVPFTDTLLAARQVLTEAAALGRTLYIAPPPAFDPDWSAHTRKVGQAVCGICSELGVPTFDLHQPLTAQAGYMASLKADGIHPDAAGYGSMAALLRGWEPLVRLLGL